MKPFVSPRSLPAVPNDPIIKRRGLPRALLAFCAAVGFLPVGFAQWPNLPSAPLAVQAVGDPNILLTIDDSGSMASAFAPDSISDISTQAQWLSPRVNAMAYNPFETYVAPYSSLLDGSKLTASFTSAYMSGFDTSLGGAPVNLRTGYKVVYSFNPADTSFNTVPELYQSSYVGLATQAAFVYSFYTDLSPTNALPTPGVDTPTSFVRRTAIPASCTGPTAFTNNSCYIKVTIPTAHESNFATWYSFYKTRNLTVASSANIAFYGLDPKFRVSWQTLNTCTDFNSGSCNGYDNTARANKLRRLSDTTHKTSFFQYLARLPAAGGTPLRAAVERAGTFIKTTGIESPRANQLGVSETGPDSAPISACRGNYHVLLTDGVWNGTANSTNVGNADSTGRTLGDGTTTYIPAPPYSDANSNSVADLAFSQWATDAQPLISNSVAPFYDDPDVTTFSDPRNDPATWQHMNTFAIGLGLTGFLNGSGTAPDRLPIWGGSTFAGDFSALSAGTVSWPTTSDNSAGNVADLWHAAINGRGKFFSADTPSSISKAFRDILSRVAAANSSSGQVASSSRRIASGSLSFSVGYKTGDWVSTITASAVNSDGTLGAAVWSTDTTLTSDAPARNLFTWNAATGLARAFAWTAFTTAETTSLFGNDAEMLNYLRGDRSKESTKTVPNKFRQRKNLLGDVVGSELVASSQTDQGFEFLPAAAGGTSYRSFVSKKKSVAFVGANDGMLHAFSTAGTELFGYIPSSVLPKLKELPLSPLVWQPLVDGPLTLGDVYLGGAWKTILVGGLGGGGSGVFGLDVTGVTQTTGSGTFSASNVLFDVTDVEMGYSFSKPVIGRTSAGNWVAIWGNGYGGASKRAYLFVYDLTAKTLSKFDTGSGTALDPNGLGSPAGVEFSAGNIIAVYAGDYKGSMWKFTVTASGGFQPANSTTPFFLARDSANKAQPISAAPEVALHPAGGVMVLFGTGKFFETQDRSTRDVQTFYGVRDTGQTASSLRADLVAQTITAGLNLSSSTRAVSTNAVDYKTKRGWYLDFNTTIDVSSPSGERIIARPILLGDTVAFATYAPSVDACKGTGQGYLMLANVFVGGQPSPFLDLNGDGVINSSDRPATGDNYAGVKVADGGSLVSPVASLVGVQPPGVRGTPPAGQTCGRVGQIPCAAPDPPGCSQGLILKNGLCAAPSCQRGSLMVQSAGTAQCTFVADAKYPRWMELKWK